ncbi:MAG TPA: hypothetical protein VF516_12345 [Kofleriaceae bacterium]
MPDETPEEAAAIERIEVAISDYLKLHPGNRFLTSWVVLTSATSIDSDGDEETRYAWIFPPRGLPWHTALGLMDIHRLLMTQRIADS